MVGGMKSRVVFVPGLVSDNRAWSDVCELVGAQHEVGIANLFGASSIRAMAQAVLEQFDGELVPVGHSMGGRVAMEIARLAPERVDGLVLVATGAHPLAEGEIEKRLKVIELANTQGMQALCDQWLPPMLAPGCVQSKPELYQRLEQMVLEAGAAVHEQQIRALIDRPDGREVLRKLTVPTLFVAGEFDGWSTPAQHHQMAQLVESAEVAEVKGAGHFLQVEQPGHFSQLLLDWLKRQLC